MKKQLSTKKALMLSVLSLCLCLAMLLGTTFAWFTDSVTSSGNIIQTGTLDIEMMWADGDEDPDTVVWNDASKGAIFNSKLWEPGFTDAKHMNIINNGTLALKYQLRIEPNGTVSKLADVIDVYFIEGATQLARADLDALTPVGSLAEVIKSGITYGTLTAGTNRTFTIVLKMQETAGNEYQNLAIGTDFAIKLLATQLDYEGDSFGTDYDKGAALPWGNTADYSWYDPDKTEFTLYTAEEFAGFAAIVNGTATAPATTFGATSSAVIEESFKGKTIKLSADLDLANRPWTPIGACNTPTYFQGTFDGQGHTISNLNVDKSTDEYMYTTAGLFGWVDAGTATVQNLNVNGATVKGSHWVGVIAGYWTGVISNCTVNNATVIGYNVNDDANGDKIGGIVGYMNSGAGKLEGNTVSNSTITGYRDVAGLAGAVATSNTVTGNKVANVTVTYSSGVVGEIVSPKTDVVVDDTNTASNVKIVKAVAATNADDFAGALNGYDNELADKNISIVLSGDLDIAIGDLGNITGGSGEYKLGTPETESITIDLNGYRLNITTTYWSAIGAQNPNAVFTIKNGTMTSTGNSAGTWNAWDIRLCNCNYVIENVVFEKAVALDNAGKSTTMKNVTITDTHNADTYALWITSEGQTVDIDGLTVDMMAATDGRGIKIDNQYVDASSKVTLNVKNATFKTEEKGAILVKTPAGADITLSNVNIENVIDATNAVWIDEDAAAYADLVTVTGGTKIIEADVITSTNKLNTALAAGKTELFLAAGEYDINNGQGKTLTITGLSKKVVIKVVGGEQGEAGGQLDYGLDGSTVTFNNLTIKTNNQTYAGYARLVATYNNCVFENCYCLNGNSTFTDCTFNVSGDQYNVWTWGAPVATFTNCTFNSDGKAVLLYGTANTKLTLNDCTFNDKGGLTDLKAAVEIGNDYGKSYELIVNNATVNGYEINDKGISTGTTLWANKNSMSQEKLNVVVDGVDVY